MRTEYGKMVYLMQDACGPVGQQLLHVNVMRNIKVRRRRRRCATARSLSACVLVCVNYRPTALHIALRSNTCTPYHVLARRAPCHRAIPAADTQSMLAD
jgi:hypothetical protein